MKYKITSIILAVVILLQANTFVFAKDKESELTNVVEMNRENIKKDGDFFTYKDDNYSIAAQITNEHSVNISIYDIKNNVLKEYIGINSAKTIEELFEMAIDNSLKWTKYYNDTNMMSYRSGNEYEVREELERVYGPEYFDRIIYGQHFDNNVCRVYEDQTFDIYRDTGKYFKAGTSLATLVAFFSLPASVIKAAVVLIKTAYDVYVIAKDVLIEKYVANVNNWREARIDNKNYVSAGRTIYNSCIWSETGRIELHEERVTGDNDRFNNYQKMADDSIYQYQTGY